ncbi:NAD-P-binding protein [Obba rivulosa]|uniref:NAD-P-binding protein n=1 Tax=Obba rivulosa TaxID=1052685 RepID=A0A8E2J2U5_9APHY|nr:NAD-P-binding protein [Obba rivulosa]
MHPFILVAPATRGLSLALTRYYLRTTDLPVFATYRSGDANDIKKNMLSTLANVDPARLKLLHLELTSEDSMASAADALSEALPQDTKPFIHTALLTGGVLYPERKPSDLDHSNLLHTFQINVISHLLLIKHFLRFLPTPEMAQDISAAPSSQERALSRWVHVSARVGSISDNRLGGWYSYRASKAALNQVIRTTDLHLKSKKIPAMCVGVHPGTVRTELSKQFWQGVPESKLFEPDDAAQKLGEVVKSLEAKQRGKIWDWAGNEVPP